MATEKRAGPGVAKQKNIKSSLKHLKSTRRGLTYLGEMLIITQDMQTDDVGQIVGPV